MVKPLWATASWFDLRTEVTDTEPPTFKIISSQCADAAAANKKNISLVGHGLLTVSRDSGVKAVLLRNEGR
jgi:hypothetical protein